jgi:hypothetical protein
MMTARFLLHLRKWEAKYSVCASTNNEDSTTGSVLEFAGNPNQRASRSFVDDFGDDPVQRAEQSYGRHSLAPMSEYRE